MTTALIALGEELKRQAEGLGATYFGIANLELAQEEVLRQGGSFLAQFPYAVSVGVALSDAIVDELHQHQNSHIGRIYFYHTYNAMAGQLDSIALKLALSLQRQGYKALPVPQGVAYDPATLTGLFSHKLSAHLSGLGWIGKSCLLVTRDRGPRARWVTVLTNAPLPAGVPVSERCGQCQLCVEVCPAQAFTGASFSPDEPREARMDAPKCRNYIEERAKTLGTKFCGLCVYICPFGRSNERLKKGA